MAEHWTSADWRDSEEVPLDWDDEWNEDWDEQWDEEWEIGEQNMPEGSFPVEYRAQDHNWRANYAPYECEMDYESSSSAAYCTQYSCDRESTISGMLLCNLLSGLIRNSMF